MPKSPRDRSTSSFDSSVWDPGEGKDHVFSPSIPSMPHKTGPSSWQIPAGTRWRIWSATEAPDNLYWLLHQRGSGNSSVGGLNMTSLGMTQNSHVQVTITMHTAMSLPDLTI